MGVDLIVLQQLAVSFGLGLLLGLQRERAESSIGGIRTFPLIAIFGTICGLLGKTFGGWMVAAGLLALVATVVYSNFAKMKSGDIGVTGGSVGSHDDTSRADDARQGD